MYSESREIDLLITPLQCYYNNNFRTVDIATKLHKRLHGHPRVPFTRLQHWAICIGSEQVYEVTSYGSPDGSRRLNVMSLDDWWAGRKDHEKRRLFIGMTSRTHDELERIANALWHGIFKHQYEAMSRNCQSFVELFKQLIHDDKLMTDKDVAKLDDMPSSFNPFYMPYHLKQARMAASTTKKYALRWSGVLGSPCSKKSDNSEKQKERRPSKVDLPAWRRSRWLELINEESKKANIEHKDDFRAIVETVNQRHKEEKRPCS